MLIAGNILCGTWSCLNGHSFVPRELHDIGESPDLFLILSGQGVHCPSCPKPAPALTYEEDSQ